MSVYTDGDIKDRAIAYFINIVIANNKSLGQKLKRNRDSIRAKALSHIQQIGVTAYAEKVLKRNSDHRDELLYIIDEE